MGDLRNRARYGRAGRVGLAVLVVLVVGVAASLGFHLWGQPENYLERLPRVTVRRTDLNVTVKAPGKVESSEKTLIECELENLRFRTHGQSLGAGGSSTIIEIVPDGSQVHEGQVLCRLEASDYEELVRQQRIKVEEARSDHLKTRLTLETAEVALREYRDGLLIQTRELLLGQIATDRANLGRQRERVDWMRQMGRHGYVPASKVKTEEQSLQRAELTLSMDLTALENLNLYEAPKQIQVLENAVENERTNLAYQVHRLQRHEDRLANFEEQVERCTIRAPHDGRVVYANEDDRDSRVELGARVRQHQDLFFLPNLSRMEVEALLNETIVDRVEVGMPARIRIEGLPEVELEGEVVKVSRFPQTVRSWRSRDDIKNYVTLVRLDTVPDGLLPGMTAEVEIQTARRPDALVVPSGALAYDRGRPVCYVASGERLEPREVQIGEKTAELLEVTAGLSEGEEVILEPSRLGDQPALALDAPTPNEGGSGLREAPTL